MHEPLTDGVIRKMWIDRAGPYRDHLLRLDKDSRRNRFGGAVSDEFIENYIELSLGLDAVIHGFFVDGILRGVAELRPLGNGFAEEAEAAFSIETPWQSNGVGTALLARTLEADLKFDFGSVIGEVEAAYPTPISMWRELVADTHGFATAMLDVQ